MSTTELIEEIEALARRIEATAPEKQHLFHLEFHAVVQRMKARGIDVPPHAKALDARLGDAAFDADHENMPV